MIPIQYALRRRMIGQKRIPKWTLTIQSTDPYSYVAINGKTLSQGTHEVDDGTIATFKALSLDHYGRIMVDGKTVASNSTTGESVIYKLEVHANYRAKISETTYYLTWEITTQQ